ncbi:Uromodulin, secreted form like [Actinidia chinensis var. chinensis]|uniref:Uromodulin, secreted form like n=1 Tax=Actinidia chinensis var. chinensis TaxID=1590841 RepID=A0A2R6PRV5_ACTCC|nr:Uromodulin, secreted form like [Actinidia chinensis var. chinensis]
MARVRNFWNHSKTTALIWIISAILFYSVFQMAIRNSSSLDHRNPSTSSDTPISNAEQRSRLYDKMAKDLDEHGATFLKHGETSQSLSLSDLFTVKGGSVTPILKAAIPPVRANVLYLSTEYSIPISEAVRRVFLPHFDKMIWFQNSTLYHFSMFHASHHIAPVPATEEEIEAEAYAVKAVAGDLCPLKIVLDRVVLTSTGVLLGCWQVISGTDPITIRAKLRSALPHAPVKQLYDAAILHTSFARVLGQPNASSSAEKTSDLQFFHDLVTQINNQIHGFQATVSELWYVEEFDVLALALNGKMKVRKFHFGCSKP